MPKQGKMIGPERHNIYLHPGDRVVLRDPEEPGVLTQLFDLKPGRTADRVFVVQEAMIAEIKPYGELHFVLIEGFDTWVDPTTNWKHPRWINSQRWKKVDT